METKKWLGTESEREHILEGWNTEKNKLLDRVSTLDYHINQLESAVSVKHEKKNFSFLREENTIKIPMISSSHNK